MIEKLAHPVLIRVAVLDEDIINLHQRAHRRVIKEDMKMIKGILLTFIENRSTPLLCASEKVYRIDVDRMTNEQIEEFFTEWVGYDI